MLGGKIGGLAARFAVDDEVDPALSIEADILGVVARHFAEAEALENRLEHACDRRCELDELEAHEAHRVSTGLPLLSPFVLDRLARVSSIRCMPGVELLSPAEGRPRWRGSVSLGSIISVPSPRRETRSGCGRSPLPTIKRSDSRSPAGVR